MYKGKSYGNYTHIVSLSYYFEDFKRHLPWLISILLLNSVPVTWNDI